MTTLGVHNVGLTYGSRTALKDVSLEIPSGSLVAILGPSGCGKTSLLMAIAGLLGVDEGVITAGNRELSRSGKRVPPEQRGIGWVPQDASLFPHLSVRDNIGFGLRKGSTPGACRRAGVVGGVGGFSGPRTGSTLGRAGPEGCFGPSTRAFA